MNKVKPRLVVLITHPIQYYAPLYRTLSARDKIDLHVVFLTDAGASAYHDPGFGRTLAWDIPLLEGYPHTIVERGLNLDQIGFWGRHSQKILSLLNQLHPDFILIHGYASRMNWIVSKWAIRRRIKLIYTSDSNANNPRSSIINLIKSFVISKFFKNLDYFLSPSEANRNYLIQFKADDRRIIRFPFSIDYQRWSTGAFGPSTTRAYKFAWAGKFIALKRPMDFIAALKIISEKTEGGVDALLIGDGPLRNQIEEAIKSLPASCRIKLTGFVNQMDMPAALQQAHTFVFSSERESYGLIATEAAAAGLALIVADRIGCVGETGIARPGVNALIYPAGDINALAEVMYKFIKTPKMQSKMQQASQEIARQHDISISASIIENMLLTTQIKSNTRDASIVGRD